MNYIDTYLLACKDEDFLKQRYLARQYIKELTPFLRRQERQWYTFIDTGRLTTYQYFNLITNIYHNIDQLNKALVVKLLFLCEWLNFEAEVKVLNDEILQLLYNFNMAIRMNRDGHPVEVLNDVNLIVNTDFYKFRYLLQLASVIFDKRIKSADLYSWMSDTTYWLAYIARYAIAFIATKVSKHQGVREDMVQQYTDIVNHTRSQLEEYARYRTNITLI